MELRQLKSLCLIVQHGTVKEAAKRSFLTSSAVSLQIKTLERELGIKLFEHAGKKLVLTTKGESLYQDAQRILESVREALERTVTATGEFTGRISMVAPACLRNFYLPAIARFRANRIGIGIIHNICVGAADKRVLSSLDEQSSMLLGINRGKPQASDLHAGLLTERLTEFFTDKLGRQS